MPTDDERREVARRMRELPTDMYQAMSEWENDGLFIDAVKWDEVDYSQIHNVLLSSFPAEYMHPCDYKELHDRLADLIDPQERTCHNVSDDKFGNFRCSECGCFWPNYFSEEHNFCPGCGARITEVD